MGADLRVTMRNFVLAHEGGMGMPGRIFNPNNKPVVLWGAGMKTRWLLQNCHLDFPVECIIDSDPEKSQTVFCGLDVVSPGEIEQLQRYFVIVIPQNCQEEIFSFLSQKNMQHTLDYIGLSELAGLYRGSYEKKMLADISDGYKVMALPVFPIGDICTIISFIKPYKEMINQPLSLYVGSAKNQELLEVCTDIDKAEALCMSPMLFEEEDEFLQEHGILDLKYIFALFKGEKYLDGPAEVRAFFGLPQDTECNRIGMCNFGNKDNVEDVFRKYGLTEGRTVFIVPYGDWLGRQVVTEGFWAKLCKRLELAGYAVIFNADREIVPGVPSLFLNVLDVPLFSEMCGNVVGARTGLLNYIAFFTDVMIQAIWPGDDNPHFETDYWKNWCEFGGVSQSERSGYYMNNGLSIQHESGREQRLIEFIHEADEKDIAFIIENLEGRA